MKKFLARLLSFIIVVSALSPFSLNVAANTNLSDDIIILYTNDIHTYVDGEISYDVLSALKSTLKKEYKHVLLADAGDHIQGTAYGSMDKGETIIKMMNAVPYDIATLGNHEFDYGMDGCLNAVNLADFPYISANFYHEKNGVRTDNVLDSFKIFDCGKEKIAFIGITTPETFAKSTSAYFRDENGNLIYGISGGDNGKELQDDVQNAVNSAKKQGATKVIALGHLGIDLSSKPWTSDETIKNTTGIDAFIDGHSHSTVKGDTVKDKDGNPVVLTQTGSYFDRIGIMKVESDTGNITTDFIELKEIPKEDNDNYSLPQYKLTSDILGENEVITDTKVREIKDALITAIDEKLGEKIGKSNIVFDNFDKNGNRLVRSAETNAGDFAADALYYLFDNMGMDVDIAVMNGGGVRNTAISGDITYKTCKDIHTFGNVACLQAVSGQQILDALEWGAREVGKGENGGFLQVSGITYKIDTSTENTVRKDVLGTWIAGPDKYRVYDCKVYNKSTNTYDDLDLDATYNLAGYNYTLRNLGDGYSMFLGCENILDYVMEDYMVIANYVKGFNGNNIDAENSPLKTKYNGIKLNYKDTLGSGRIQITDNRGFTALYKDVTDNVQYYDDILYVTQNGLFKGTSNDTFGLNEGFTRGMLATVLYRNEGSPKTDNSSSFNDLDNNAYYKDSINWANENNIVYGYTAEVFAPDDIVTRQQLAAILLRYARYKGYDTHLSPADTHEYTDRDAVSDYAKEGVAYCFAASVMKGNEANMFSPSDFVTRGEAAAVLHRFLTIK